MTDLSPRFIAGLVLLLLNPLFGWGGAALCVFLGRRTGKRLWYGLGTGLYAVSWAMLAAGLFLAGPQGVSLAEQLVHDHGPLTLIVLAAVVLAVLVWRWMLRSSCGCAAKKVK